MYIGPLKAISNREDWQFTIELIDPATNDFVSFTGATIIVMVRPYENTNTVLTGSNLDGHITVTGPGTASVLFPRSEVTSLPPRTYDVGITVKLSTGLTYQLFAGTLPVADGVVDI